MEERKGGVVRGRLPETEAAKLVRCAYEPDFRRTVQKRHCGTVVERGAAEGYRAPNPTGTTQVTAGPAHPHSGGLHFQRPRD